MPPFRNGGGRGGRIPQSRFLDYEKAIKAANTCNDLETATARFYEEQARVEVPDSTEREALKPLVEKAQKAFVAKFSSLDCASEPEEGEE